MFMLNHVKNYDKKLSELTKNYLIKNGCFFFQKAQKKASQLSELSELTRKLSDRSGRRHYSTTEIFG